MNFIMVSSRDFIVHGSEGETEEQAFARINAETGRNLTPLINGPSGSSSSGSSGSGGSSRSSGSSTKYYYDGKEYASEQEAVQAAQLDLTENIYKQSTPQVQEQIQADFGGRVKTSTGAPPTGGQVLFGASMLGVQEAPKEYFRNPNSGMMQAVPAKGSMNEMLMRPEVRSAYGEPMASPLAERTAWLEANRPLPETQFSGGFESSGAVKREYFYFDRPSTGQETVRTTGQFDDDWRKTQVKQFSTGMTFSREFVAPEYKEDKTLGTGLLGSSITKLREKQETDFGGARRTQLFKEQAELEQIRAQRGTVLPETVKAKEATISILRGGNVKEAIGGTAAGIGIASLSFTKGLKESTVDLAVSFAQHPVETGFQVVTSPLRLPAYAAQSAESIWADPLVGGPRVAGQLYGSKKVADLGIYGAKKGVQFGQKVEAAGFEMYYNQKYKGQLMARNDVQPPSLLNRELSVELRGRPIQTFKGQSEMVEVPSGSMRSSIIQFEAGRPQPIPRGQNANAVLLTGLRETQVMTGGRANIVGQSRLPSTGRELTTPTGASSRIVEPTASLVDINQFNKAFQKGKTLGIAEDVGVVTIRKGVVGDEGALFGEWKLSTETRAAGLPYQSKVIITEQKAMGNVQAINYRFPGKGLVPVEDVFTPRYPRSPGIKAGQIGKENIGISGQELVNYKFTNLDTMKPGYAQELYVFDRADVKAAKLAEFGATENPAQTFIYNPTSKVMTESLNSMFGGSIRTLKVNEFKKPAVPGAEPSKIRSRQQYVTLTKTRQQTMQGTTFKGMAKTETVQVPGFQKAAQVPGFKQSSGQGLEDALMGKQRAFQAKANGSRQKTRSAFVQPTFAGQMQTPDIAVVQGIAQAPRQAPIQVSRQTPITVPKFAPVTIAAQVPVSDIGWPTPVPTVPVSAPPDIPFDEVPPPFVPPMIPAFPTGNFARSYGGKKGKSGKPKIQYTASIEAVMLGIRGKAGKPKPFSTGLSIRPMR